MAEQADPALPRGTVRLVLHPANGAESVHEEWTIVRRGTHPDDPDEVAAAGTCAEIAEVGDELVDTIEELFYGG